jgi:hypothetical protein
VGRERLDWAAEDQRLEEWFVVVGAQEALFISAMDLSKSDGRSFYKEAESVLAESEFDEWIAAD